MAVRKMACVVFWAFFVLLGVTLTEAQGTLTYVALNSLAHCFPCPAGTHVREHCTEDLTNSTCAPCPSGYYSDIPNNKTYCKLCRAHCPKSGSVTQNCTASMDLGCRCIDGYHKHPIDHIDPHWTCRKHTACKEGEGEVFRGNHTHNTKCEKCIEKEQFVNKSDPNHPVCQTCTTCAPTIREVKKCSLDHDRECDESQNGTYVDVTSTVPSVKTTADVTDQPSGSLSGALIAGIVYGVLVVAGIIAGAGLYILTKWNNRIQITRREKIVVVLAIVIGLGLLVVSILLIWAYRRGRGSSEQTYTMVQLASDADGDAAAVGDAAGDAAVRDAAVSDADGDAAAVSDAVGDAAVRDAAVSDAVGDAAVRDAAAVGDAVGDAAAVSDAVGDAAVRDAAAVSDAVGDAAVRDAAAVGDAVGDAAAVSDAVGDAAVRDAAVSDAVGDAAVRDAAVSDAVGDAAVRDAAVSDAVGDAAVRDAAVGDAVGDAAVRDAAVGDAAAGDAAPLLAWSLDFIEGTVFPFLFTYLGNEWRTLITALPGWRPTKASAVIEQSVLDERYVKDQIFACLKAWKQQCPQKVTRQNILRALEATGVKRIDLKQKLETMFATSA